MAQPRTILHADLDAFYASVEQRDDPSLRGKPVVVGGPRRRGVVAAASYEARRFGIHSAMPMARALRACPNLVVRPPRMSTYAAISRQVFAILESYSPLVEPLSLDEAFLDLTGTEKLHGEARGVALAIKGRVRSELGLVISVGIAPNKLVAKIASDAGKPDGLVVIGPEEVARFLTPLPVARLPGVGQVTERELRAQGIETIGALATLPRDVLEQRLGVHGVQLAQLSRGIDEREVVVERVPESIGQEDTYADDLVGLEALAPLVQDQADRVAHRLRQEGFTARVVVLKVRTADFHLRTRRRKLSAPTSDGDQIGRVARELLATLLKAIGPVRLTGVTATALLPATGPGQLSFPEPAREAGESLGRTLDQINARFGKETLVRGTALSSRGRKLRRS